jgi:hypothetical protein
MLKVANKGTTYRSGFTQTVEVPLLAVVRGNVATSEQVQVPLVLSCDINP